MTSLLRLYPRSWRDRYEAEFIHLMESRPPTVGDRVDIVRGAVDARLHPQVGGPDGDPIVERRRAAIPAALAALAGVAWSAWVVAGLAQFRGWDGPMPENVALLTVLNLVAGLSVAAAHVAIAVSAGDRLHPITGLAVTVASVAFTGTALGIGTLGSIALVASAVVAIGLRRPLIPGPLMGLWAGSAIASLGAMIAFIVGGGQQVWLLGGIATYGVAWLAIGGYLWSRGVPQMAMAGTPQAPPQPRD